MTTLAVFTRLTRLPIAALTTLSTLTAFLIVQPRVSPTLALACLGVLGLALGASSLNQYQERELDARMPRTRTRPLPTGAIRPRPALLFSLGLVLAGTALLYAVRPLSAALGLAAIALYNGLYTPLKRVMSFVAVPGGVIGTLPPAIGWTAAGGAVEDGRLWALAAFFFVWQVPHFWLLLLARGDEYAAAGLPSPIADVGRRALERLTFACLLATAAAAPLLAGFELLRSAWAGAALLCAGLLLVGSGVPLLRRGPERRAPFGAINYFLSAVMFVLVIDALTSAPATIPR